jgi:hypothetical protein
MDINRLTQKSQEALHDAQTKALRYGHTEIEASTRCAPTPRGRSRGARA